jgi:hypothetical protein
MAPESPHFSAAASAGTGPLLIALLGAPLAWALHLGLSYFLVALDCATSWNGGRSGVLLATIGCALAAAGAGLYAWRTWKRMRFSRTQREAMNPAPTHEFFLLGGVVLALLFTAAIMMAGLSPLVLPMCA